MHWPQGEKIERIDGIRAVLILRQDASLTSEHFETESLEELLRAALVGIVAALDRYCHDVVVSRVVVQLRRSEKKVSGELRRLRVPIFAVKAAVEHARKRRGKGGKRRTRPMVRIRHAVQDLLHLETYQCANDIARALSMVGIQTIYEKCEQQMRDRPPKIMRRLCQFRSPKKLSVGIAATVAGSTHSTTPTRRTLLKFYFWVWSNNSVQFGVWRNISVQEATLLSGSMTRQALSITPIGRYCRLIAVWTRPSAHCCFTLSDR